MFRDFVSLSLGLLLACGSLLADSHGEEDRGTGLRPMENHHLGIPRDAFGERFLMSMSVIPQVQAATSTGLAGKVITFELFADAVDMYEDVDGLVVTRDLPAKRFVASFPIVDQDEDHVTIDFNRGMRRAFTDIWYSVSRRFNPFQGEDTYEIPGARVFEMREAHGGSQLVIRQGALLRSRSFLADTEERYEIRYFIKPYRPGDYQGKEPVRLDDPHVRFFETAARLEETTGRSTSRIARFDLEKPLKFYYSHNTPEDYEEAVRGGIEYWNRAFGRKVVEAERAPEGVTAPDAEYNVVQWVPWDSAGFAYADILVDPVTGESLHGQAYMTSVFAISGISRARVILRRMRALLEEEEEAEKEDGEDGEEKEHPAHAWPHSTVCRMSSAAFARQYAEGIEEILSNPEASEKAVLQMSRDYVRSIVAHEVGHVLGLRHNFAGSLTTTLDHQELDNWIDAYLKGEDLSEYKDDYTSNSVMEYQEFPASAFTGAKMRTTDTVLPHDRAAIQWGYFDDRGVVEDKAVYAADRDSATWDDVTVFDYGRDPLVSAYAEIGDAVRRLPSSLIETFIQARAPRDPRDRVPLEQVNLSASAVSVVGIGLRNMLRWFDDSARSLIVEREFDFVGSLNTDEVHMAHWKRLNKQVEMLGGIDRALFSFLPVKMSLDLKKKPQGVADAPRLDPDALVKRVDELLDSPAYAKFIGLDGKEYEFDEKEREIIRKRARVYFRKLADNAVLQACTAFASARRDLGLAANKKLADEDIVLQMEKRIIELASKVILEKDEDNRIEGTLNKGGVWVKDYRYPLATRQAAARMLADGNGSFSRWSRKGKSDIHGKLKGEVNAAFNIKPGFTDSQLSRTLRKWYLDQQTLLGMLPAMRPPSPPQQK